MIDEIEKLRRVVNATTPTPDPAFKAETMRLAQKKFDEHQGSTQSARPIIESRPISARLITGVSTMLEVLSSRGGLVATTAIVAVGVVILTPQGRDMFSPPPFFQDQGEITSVNEAPSTSSSVVPAEVAVSTRERAERRIKNSQLDGSLPHDVIAMEEPVMSSPVPSVLSAESDEVGASNLMASDRTESDFAMQSGNAVPKSDSEQFVAIENREAFANAPSNSVKVTSDEPVSTFSIDVDTASYPLVRSSLNGGVLPPVDGVRIEEMINYFPYDYTLPDASEGPFRPTVSVLPTPWNSDTKLVHIALQGRMPPVQNRPPLNLVFLIDTSGSMQDANKLPLLKQSFRLMLSHLSPDDQVAIVTYAGSAGQVLEPTSANDRTKILEALNHLEAGGSTAGQQGLQQAYSVAAGMKDEGEVTRIVLATDGDFNVGLSSPDALKNFIAKKRDSGTYLSVLGFGRGNLDDATMQALAQNGNGQASYIDTFHEAQKVLVDQLTGALFPIANDVKIQMEFNPAVVAEYRLIGYETRALNREDFNNDSVDAGEIGAGHSVTALYEVSPVGSPAVLNSPLRYQTEAATDTTSGELGFLRMRYKNPGESKSNLIETAIFPDDGLNAQDANFAAAIAGFGQLLRGDTHLGDWSWQNAISLANQFRGEDTFGYRAEAISLMRLAKSLSEN